MTDLTIKINGLVDNHTCRRLSPVIPTPPDKDGDDIVEYGIRQKVKKVGEGEYDFVLEDEVYEVSRVNRQAFIAKDADDVGVLNILEKIRRSGDYSLLNQTGAVISDELQDYSDVPSNLGEALNAVKSGANSFAGLKEIFGDISFGELATMSDAAIAEKLQEYISKQAGSEPEKGNE